MIIGGPALLAIDNENASNDSSGAMSRQTTYQRHGILGGYGIHRFDSVIDIFCALRQESVGKIL